MKPVPPRIVRRRLLAVSHPLDACLRAAGRCLRTPSDPIRPHPQPAPGADGLRTGSRPLDAQFCAHPCTHPPRSRLCSTG